LISSWKVLDLSCKGSMYGHQRMLYMPERHNELTSNKIRQIWSKKWNVPPNNRVGRSMIEKSLSYKEHKLAITHETELKKLIKQYKRNPKCFDENYALKPGTKLVRNWKGKQHSITVKPDGFEYQNCIYPSLSKIANDITGSKWNGYLFFGVKKT